MPRTFTIGISGISSSGKTTLSRYLRTIFRSSLVLFQDDYYLPDSSIPVSSSGLQDWDCVDAFDFSKLGQTLDYVHKHGVLPPDTKTITDDSPVGEKLVDDKFVEEMRARVAGAGLREDIKIVFLEGILLFQQGNIVENKLDARILLRAPYERAKQRREARTRYVTIEGFWEDPPGYFDKIVWPNYVKEHKHLFVNGDIEGNLKPEVLDRRRIHTPNEMEMTMTSMLEWAVDIITDELKKIE